MGQWVNSESRFGWISRGLHWVMALIILILLGVGFFMAQMPVSPMKLEVYTVHKSFGMIILGLGVMRVIWWVTKTLPGHLPTHALWERFLAKTIHIVFYFSFFVMPLSGWLMSSAAGFPVSFFGLFEFPAITGKNEGVFEAMKAVHEVSAFILIGGIGLHIMGALKHHIIDRDETLKRMGASIVIAVLGLALLSVPVFLAAKDILGDMQVREVNGAISAQDSAALAQASADQIGDVQKWVIDSAASAIDFSFTQYGQDVNGVFASWSGDIAFDPDNLAQSSVRVEIDIASIQTGSDDRDEQAKSTEWFDALEYPRAVFESESFTAQDANHYLATGYLSLRGVKVPVSFPFVLEFSEKSTREKQADMSGDFILQRLDFGVGQGQWESTEAIGGAVKIAVRVQAVAADE